MNEQPEVLMFLFAVRDSLYGDLENFDRLCKEAEKKEKGSEVDSDKIESNELVYITPITTTPQTTSSGNVSKSGSIGEIKYYRSTIPHMMAVFSTIDLVGFLLGTSEVKPDSEIYITNFFNFLDIETHQKYLELDIYKKLALIYRSGMAHSFFPKKKYGISADSKNPDELFYFNNDIEVLNAKYLIKITKQTLNNVLSNSSLFKNMEDQFQKILAFDEKKTKDLK